MKNIVKLFFAVLLTAGMVTSCMPDENFSMTAPGTLGAVTFSEAASPQTPNIRIFTNTTNMSGLGVYNVVWDIDGTRATGVTARGYFPFAGTYTVTMTVTNSLGSSSTTQQITIANDDMDLVDTPLWRMVTGGADAPDGRTWVLDRYNNFTAQVREALDRDIRGHAGLYILGGPPSQGWWGAGPNHWGAGAAPMVGIYDMTFTFVQVGTTLTTASPAGLGYGRDRVISAAGLPITWYSNVVNRDGDAAFTYTGGSYNFALAETGPHGFPQMTLGAGGFMAYYVGSQVYDIIYLSNNVMALRVGNTLENQQWVFIFTTPEYNYPGEPPPPPPLQANPLFEDFEGETQILTFENMGGGMTGLWANPMPLPINESRGVLLYNKTAHNASNVQFTASGYRFDLTEQNIVSFLIFVPSWNDFETPDPAPQGWATAPNLQPRVAVRLENTLMGGNAWQTRAQREFLDLPLDTWVEIVADFSAFSTREDFNRIIIQIGGEGHNREGIFFIDDFAFRTAD